MYVADSCCDRADVQPHRGLDAVTFERASRLLFPLRKNTTGGASLGLSSPRPVVTFVAELEYCCSTRRTAQQISQHFAAFSVWPSSVNPTPNSRLPFRRLRPRVFVPTLCANKVAFVPSRPVRNFVTLIAISNFSTVTPLARSGVAPLS